MATRKKGSTGSRASKVGEQIRQILSQRFLSGFVRDPRFLDGRVTITEVEMSPDLAHAHAYVSIFSDDKEARAGVLAALGAAARMLRRELGSELGLRYTPEIRFFEDTSIQYGSNIDRILKEIEKPSADDDERE